MNTESNELFWYFFGMTNGIAWGALILSIALYFIGRRNKDV